MWILTIKNRQYWLLPGKPYTVGRSTQGKSDAIDVVIQESSVSRRHLVLEVSSATEDAISHPSIRSQLHVTDLGSRFGTVLDGRHRLAKDEKVAVPFSGSHSTSLKIGSVVKAYLKWDAFVVSYSTGQSGLAHETMWNHALSLLKPLDVKLLPDPTEKTSVLVKSGTTLSTVYFALAVGIPIANSHYIQALHDAAIAASASGTESPVIPDPGPYNPDPAWAPDPRRKTCLAGCKFHSPFTQHAESLKPIIEAAGGVYTDAPTSDTLWVLPPRHDVLQIPQGATYVELISIFTAITKSRAIEPSDIHTAQKSGRRGSDSPSSAAKRHKLGAEDGGSLKGTAPSRPRHTRVNFFDALTSTQPGGAQTPPPPPNTAQAVDSKAGDEATTGAHSKFDQLKISQSNAAASEASSRDSNSRRKRRGTSREELPRKRARATAAEAPSNKQKDTPAPEGDSDHDEDIVVDDYSKIGELATVEMSMELRRGLPTPQSEQSERWSGRPNFKAFKKTQRERPPRRAEYDASPSDDDVQQNDEFTAPLSRRRRAPPLFQRERPIDTHAFNDTADGNEEELFVPTNPEGTVAPTIQAPSRFASALPGELHGDADADAEDDAFGFRFD